jgi:microtubule-associated protein-like 1/2
VFALCALRDGTLVSGGGRDRRVVLWGSDYSKVQEVEVRIGTVGWPCRILARPLPYGAPNSGLSPTTHHPTPLTCILHTPLPTQVPEDFGPVRTVAEGRGDTLYVGTTRNSILLGSVHTGFSLLVQVSTAPPPHPRPQFSFHP